MADLRSGELEVCGRLSRNPVLRRIAKMGRALSSSEPVDAGAVTRAVDRAPNHPAFNRPDRCAAPFGNPALLRE